MNNPRLFVIENNSHRHYILAKSPQDAKKKVVLHSLCQREDTKIVDIKTRDLPTEIYLVNGIFVPFSGFVKLCMKHYKRPTFIAQEDLQ